MAERPAQAFARRLKRYRDRRGWTQQNLADVVSEVGWKVDRALIAKIEAGSRGVSLDEAITLSWALGLPPALLYLPLGEADDVAIAPDVHIHPALARRWVNGELPAPDVNQFARDVAAWYRDMNDWLLHEKLVRAQDVERDSRALVRRAEYAQEGVSEARRAHANALGELSDVLTEMRMQGVIPPPPNVETVEAMRLVGINYTGPTWQPEEGNHE